MTARTSNTANAYRSPFYPAPRESLYSYLLRLSIIHGLRANQFIIKNGEWKLGLKQPSTIAYHLKKLPKELICSMLLESLPCFGLYRPLNEVEVLYQRLIIAGASQIRIGFEVTPIRFCVRCFKEQIKTFGFTYFEASWQFTHSCRKHEVPLRRFHLSAGSLKCHRALIEIMRLDQESIRTHSRLEQQNIGLSIFKHPARPRAKHIFAPCAIDLLHNLAWKKNVYPKTYTQTLDYTKYHPNILRAIHRLHFKRVLTNSRGEPIINQETKQAEGLLEELFARLEKISPDDMNSRVFKVQKKQCEQCQYLKEKNDICPASNVIAIVDTGVSTQEVKNMTTTLRKRNPCDNDLRYFEKSITNENTSIIEYNRYMRDVLAGRRKWGVSFLRPTKPTSIIRDASCGTGTKTKLIK